MTKRALKPLPLPTDDERRRAGEAARALREAIADLTEALERARPYISDVFKSGESTFQADEVDHR